MMLAIRHVIDRVDQRLLLAYGVVTTAGALDLMAHVPAGAGAGWLAAASAAQGIGVGLLFTPLAALAFSTLAAGLRTDGAGVYSLVRQLGCATGVAVMTAVLQTRMHTRLTELHDHARLLGLGAAGLHAAGLHAAGHHAAALLAYADCFRLLALATAAMLPGIFWFRVVRPDRRTATAG